MGSRRFHTKSRHGCSQCKRRRVKCDEQLPHCRNCCRRGIDCDLMNAFADTPLPLLLAHNQQSNGSPEQISSAETSREPFPKSYSQPVALHTTIAPTLSPFPDRPPQELELIHHYATVAWKSLPGRDLTGETMRDAVPREALKSDFLMRGMLSISALHLAHLQSHNQPIYLSMAVRQADVALRQSRSVINDITPANHAAIFMGLCFVNAFAFSFPQKRDLDHFCNILVLFRGCIAVLMLGRHQIRMSSLGGLLSDPTRGLRVALPQHVSDALDALQSRSELLTTDEFTRNVYRCAMHELRESFLQHFSFPDHHYNIFGWPHVLPVEYLTLLKAQEPCALAILAHYCILLHKMNDSWWAHGWGRDVFMSIMSALGPEWHFLIEWPQRMIDVNA